MTLATVGLTGVDGSRWILHGPGAAGSPARMTDGSVGDLFEAPVTVTTRQTTAAGTQYLGHHVDERTIILNLVTYSEVDSTEWARQDAAFRRALAYDNDAELWVKTEESGERRIGVRLAEAPEYTRDIDPHADATGLWRITLTALDPYWRGQTIRDTVVFTGSNFIDSVTIFNPGDVAVWPTWTLTAPARWALPNPVWDPDARDLNRLLWLPFQHMDHVVFVDSDPTQEFITDVGDPDGGGLWAQLGGAFITDPIPARQTAVDLPVHIDPVPGLPWQIPTTLRNHIAQRVRDLATELGNEGFFDLTTSELAERIEKWIQDATPAIIDWLSLDVIDKLLAPLIGKILSNAYGTTIRPLLGAQAMITIETRWLRPWG